MKEKDEEVGASHIAVRIIWQKRQLPELKEKWLIDAVIRQNVAVGLQRNIRIEGILDRSAAVRLITQLDLSGNNLATVPVLLFQLPLLRRLSLADNRITVLPVREKPKQDQSGKRGSTQSQNIPEHPLDPTGHQEEGDWTKRSNDVNDVPHLNGGVKIKPASKIGGAKRVSEQYQTSSSQNRPYSDFFPKSEQPFVDKKQRDDNEKEGKKSEENQAGNVDASPWECPLLEELDLQKNQLASVPTCMFELPSLKVLNLFRNKISKLPFEFWSAPSLKEVLLQENELICLPSNPHLTKKQERPSRLIIM